MDDNWRKPDVEDDSQRFGSSVYISLYGILTSQHGMLKKPIGGELSSVVYGAIDFFLAEKKTEEISLHYI